MRDVVVVQVYVDSMVCPCCKGQIQKEDDKEFLDAIIDYGGEAPDEARVVCKRCDMHMTANFALFPPPPECMEGACEKHPKGFK